jgi:ubiquinone/menaquinone biosynthesis C-methylase UbiE
VKPNVHEEQIRSYYDARYAGDYMCGIADVEVQRLRELLGPVPTKLSRVLDYGCGRGAWIDALISLFPHAQISGIDISVTAISKARIRFPEERLVSFDGNRAPFDSESFDLVFSYHVLEHVRDIELTVADMARLVRRGGYLCAVFPCGNSGSFEEQVVRLVRGGVERSATGEVRFYCEDPGHVRRITTGDIVRRFAIHGVNPVSLFFGNQRWGQIEWMARYGPNWIRETFDPGRAATRSAWAKLCVLRLALLALSPFVKVYEAKDLGGRIRSARNLRRRLLFATAIAARPLAIPIGAMLARASEAEWRHHRHEPGASAQYLLFQRSL